MVKMFAKGDVMIMNNRLVKLLLALVLVATLLPVTPAFAASASRSQALAYKKHSLGLTGVSNARDLGGYQTKDGRTIKFGKLFRTGNATMLLLTVLGVDKETIIEDFLLTNDYLAADRKATYKRVLDLTGSKRIAKDIASKDGVERRWIEESYKTIETYYGSIDNFLKKVIGLTAKDIKKLQKAYLTPAK